MGSKIGAFFRYVLGINTIWGVMILVSFAAAIYQHVTPTKSWIETEYLQEGINKVVINYTAKDEPVTREFALNYAAGELTLSAEDTKPFSRISPQPWLIRAERREGLVGLVWDTNAYGDYTIEVNGRKADKGKLVTLTRLTDKAFSAAEVAFKLGFGLVSTFVLFLGLMKVGEEAGVVDMVAKALGPIIRLLFPGVPKDSPANGALLMNITTSILGLGNASTPFGLKAIEELQKLNPRKDTATDAMCMMVGYNTAGFALLPTSILAILKSAGTSDPYSIIFPSLVAGMVSTLVAIIMVRTLGMLPVFKVTYTAEELASLTQPATDSKPAEKA